MYWYMKHYWTTETSDAITEYQKTEDESLYNDMIYPAFSRMSEYLVNITKARTEYDVETLKLMTI